MTAFELGAMIEPTGVAYNGLFVRGGGIPSGRNVASIWCWSDRTFGDFSDEDCRSSEN